MDRAMKIHLALPEITGMRKAGDAEEALNKLLPSTGTPGVQRWAKEALNKIHNFTS